MTIDALRTLLHPGSNEPGSLASPHIFIVEENPAIADLIVSILALAGYRPSRGELSALSQIPQEDLPSLILLDLNFFNESRGKRLLDVQAQCESRGIAPPHHRPDDQPGHPEGSRGTRIPGALEAISRAGSHPGHSRSAVAQSLALPLTRYFLIAETNDAPFEG